MGRTLAPHHPTVMAAGRRAVWAERVDGNDDVRHKKAVLRPGAPQCIKVRKSIRVSVSMNEAEFGSTGAHVNHRCDCQDEKNSSCGFHACNLTGIAPWEKPMSVRGTEAEPKVLK
jgi:hypothetical protein